MNLANIGIIIAHKDKQTIKQFEKQFAGVLNVEIVRCPLLQISSADCVVCSGNSYGMLDGTDAKSIGILIKGLSEQVKYVIDNAYYGEQPVGTTIVLNSTDPHYKTIAYVPIWRFKQELGNTINPYLAFRGLLTAVLNHNKVSETKIHTILCPPLGVDQGISGEECAKQMRLAYGFVDIGLGCSQDNAKMIDSLLN